MTMPTCFVVQGYGKKTDYTNGRVLDMDASYMVIKKGVEAAGIKCIRADEIMHSGTIDVQMYEYLLKADVVIADLSTYNVNAAFELGVRYALKPYTTIVLAEEQFKNPFDFSHIVVRPYRHLGEDGINFEEALRLIDELKVAITNILATPATDSPVYTYLPQLQPPQLRSGIAQNAPSSGSLAPHSPEVAIVAGEENPSAKAMLDIAQKRIESGAFSEARVLLSEVRKLRPNDSFVLQQLALAIYKSKQPNEGTALQEAHEILKELTPESSNNPETLGLWGSVHKRLWEDCRDRKYLDESISAYERGFYLKQDHYNGINLAYLLQTRAIEYLKAGQQEDATADHVAANRVRKKVVQLIENTAANVEDAANRYWAFASLYEAAIGMGDAGASNKWERAAQGLKVPEWMQASRVEQATKLEALMAEYRRLQSGGGHDRGANNSDNAQLV